MLICLSFRTHLCHNKILPLIGIRSTACFSALLLFAELFAGALVSLRLNLDLYVTDNDALHFGAHCAVVTGETISAATTALGSDLPRKICLSVADVELAGVSGCMHHELLILVVVCLGHQVGHHMRMLRQQRLVVNLLPLEALAEERRNECAATTLETHPWKAKVLQVQISNEVQLSVCKELIATSHLRFGCSYTELG